MTDMQVSPQREATEPPSSRSPGTSVQEYLDHDARPVPAVLRYDINDNLGTGPLDVERFIGLVNELDRQGFSPKVNKVWRAQFGPGYLASGHEDASFVLKTWTPSSPSTPGYVGRVGDMALLDATAD